MFGLGFGEIIIIAIVALLLLGPDRLPEAAKTLGKGLREIRKATDDLKDQVEKEINLQELLEDKPAKPSLVPPVPPVPARAIPGPSGPPPEATAENVPGLEVALAEAVTVAEDYSTAAVPAVEPAAGVPAAPAPQGSDDGGASAVAVAVAPQVSPAPAQEPSSSPPDAPPGPPPGANRS